jgi:aminoglycoside/choline kinase family phosphotransferase
MEQIIEAIQHLLKEKGIACKEINKIPQSGSDRMYFRVESSASQPTSFIVTHNSHVRENETFIHFTETFNKINAPVPSILAVNDDKTIYIQTDFGDRSLLNELEEKGQTDEVYQLFQKCLLALANLQIKADAVVDYNKCITSREFGKQAILGDLLYFKYYFLDTLKLPYDKEKLIGEFDKLSEYLSGSDHRYFMFRDFQSRNIMVKNGAVHFIDYQGGMKGALQYDVASLLWQAKANLSEAWKSSLLNDYIGYINELLPAPVNRERFINQYNGYVLIRLLQVMGAYGFRGLFERKAHFLTSIPLGLKNLQWFVQHYPLPVNMPEFESILKNTVSDDMINRFENVKATEKTPLTVHINSFSFLKNGYPKDSSTNGGGYVFDMRGILNPGRFDEYKKLSGQDKSVKDFLEQQTKMPDFLNSVYDIVDVSVEDYLKRGFESLSVNFGCTGGQHRSVYAAEALNRHLKNKFGVKTKLTHLNQSNWVR